MLIAQGTVPIVRIGLNPAMTLTSNNKYRSNEQEMSSYYEFWWLLYTNHIISDVIDIAADDNDITVGKFYATFLIQDYFRRFKKKKELLQKTGIGGVGVGGGGGGGGGSHRHNDAFQVGSIYSMNSRQSCWSVTHIHLRLPY